MVCILWVICKGQNNQTLEGVESFIIELKFSLFGVFYLNFAWVGGYCNSLVDFIDNLNLSVQFFMKLSHLSFPFIK